MIPSEQAALDEAKLFTSWPRSKTERGELYLLKSPFNLNSAVFVCLDLVHEHLAGVQPGMP